MDYYKNLSLEDIVYTDDNSVTCVEQWKDIPDYESLYQVSDLGRVKSLEKPRKKSTNNPNSFVRLRIMKASLGKKYLNTALYKDGQSKSFLIHHLLSIAFLKFKPNMGQTIVDHINNISTDNRLCNLQLITRRHNNVKDVKNKSEAVGLYQRNGFFNVTISFNGISCSLGSFKDKKEAIEKHKEAFDLIESNQDISHLIKKKTNKTESKGVYHINHKFTSQIFYNGFKYNLGSYHTIKEASDVFELASLLKKENKSIEHLLKKRKNRHL
jgi:hypothetical protein